jgi:hypothetical protein
VFRVSFSSTRVTRSGSVERPEAVCQINVAAIVGVTGVCLRLGHLEAV